METEHDEMSTLDLESWRTIADADAHADANADDSAWDCWVLKPFVAP